MHLLPSVAIQPNLELKTRPKLVLGSLPLAFALPEWYFHLKYYLASNSPDMPPNQKVNKAEELIANSLQTLLVATS